ncbi:MAG: NADH-ubiquinone oxidoreductase-F iron-sulfur binding region domain-containing protein [Vicinamibacterales bacterium]
MTRGAEWFSALGPEKNGGPKLFCISGQVKRPGVFEAPMKVSLRELIDDYAGGMRDGHTMKAVIPGGSSVPILLPDQLDIPASFDDVQRAGSLLGSAAIMVLDETVDMVWLAENLLHFYRHESCGKCTPCREGTDWLYRLLHRMLHGEGSTKDIALLQSVANQINGKTLCAFGDAAATPVLTTLKLFKNENARSTRGAKARVGRLPRQPAGRRPPLARRSRGTHRHARLLLLPVPPALQLVGRLRGHRRRHLHGAADLGRGDGLLRAQGLGLDAAALRPDAGRAERHAPADCRRRQAHLQGGAAAEGGRRAAVHPGARHLGGDLPDCVRAGPVRRLDHLRRLARGADCPSDRRPRCRRAGGVRGRLGGGLRHRAGRLGQQLEIRAARRPAQLGADDQLRAGLRHGARHLVLLAGSMSFREIVDAQAGYWFGCCRAGTCSRCSRSA